MFWSLSRAAFFRVENDCHRQHDSVCPTSTPFREPFTCRLRVAPPSGPNAGFNRRNGFLKPVGCRVATQRIEGKSSTRQKRHPSRQGPRLLSCCNLRRGGCMKMRSRPFCNLKQPCQGAIAFIPIRVIQPPRELFGHARRPAPVSIILPLFQ